MSERETKKSGGLTYADLKKDADGFFITNDRQNKAYPMFQKIPYGKIATPEAEQAWYEFKKFMLQIASAAEISNWIDCLEPYKIQGNKLIVYAPTKFILNYIKSTYHSIFTKFTEGNRNIKLIELKIYEPTFVKY